MVIFESETDFLNTIAYYDNIIKLLNTGGIEFPEFLSSYNSFYAIFALDEHESDTEERIILNKHKNRIEHHRVIFEEILCNLCSDEDAKLEKYKQAGRFGSQKAMELIRQLKS